MWPFDYFWDAVFGSEIDALTGLWKLVSQIPYAIGGILVAVIMAIMYPFIVLVHVAQNCWNAVMVPLIDFINNILSVPNLLINIVNTLFVGVLPTEWTIIMIASVTVVLGLRLYSFLKDISILGNKI